MYSRILASVGVFLLFACNFSRLIISSFSFLVIHGFLLEYVIFIFFTGKLELKRSVIRGVCRISQGGGPNLKISGILDIHAAKRHVASSEAASFCYGGLGACPPKKIFKNGAISCVLRANFNHFRGKKSSQKIISKLNFFTDPFIMLLPH